jgi:hypothetical protein
MITIGKGASQNAGISFDGNTNDYYAGMDNTSAKFMIGVGLTVGTTPKITMDSAGNTGVGTTSPGQKLEVNGRIRMDSWTADGTTPVYYNSATGDIGTQASDIRLKKNITEIGSAMDIIEGIKGVTFNWKDSSIGTQKTVGVIAQDVAAVMPELTYNVTGPDGQQYLGVYYDKLSPVLIEAVKEQQAEISNVQTQISNQIQNLNDQNLQITAQANDVTELQTSVNDKLSVLGATINAQSAAINNQTQDISAMKTQLASAQTKLAEDENNLLTYETSVNDLLTSMNETETMLTQKVMNHEDRIKALEDQMATMSVTAGGTIPSNVVTQDTNGNVTLAGVFKAKQVEANGVVAGSVTVKNLTPEAPTVGDGTIVAVKTDANGDGWDDVTKVDGKSVRVTTAAVTETAKIFLSCEGDPGSRYWVEKIRDPKTGELTGEFSINVAEAVKADAKFSWWIVEAK